MDILFDLDGTVTDSAPGIINSVNYALEKLHVSRRAEQELMGYIGVPLDGIFSDMMEPEMHHRIPEAIDHYRERYHEIGFRESVPYPSIDQTLDALRAEDHRLHICTAKPGDISEMILRHFELDSYFHSVHGCGLNITKSMVLTHLVESREIDPASFMVGDRASDIQAAKAAGIRSIGVTYGYGSAEELAAAGSDHVVHDHNSILPLVKGRGMEHGMA